jgi:hypothetical protein
MERSQMENKKPVCPSCLKEIAGFKDKLSIKEFTISGLCQECQDKIFDTQLDVLSDLIIDSFLDKKREKVIGK